MIAFDSPSAMIRWFDMPEGKLFLGYIEEMLELSQLRLEREVDLHEIYRRQGRIDALKDVFSLPEQFKEEIRRGKAA